MALSGTLGPDEEYWRSQHNWLLEQGYRLRPRYNPEWVPSWSTKQDSSGAQALAEDAQSLNVSTVIDAVEVSTGRHVVLKRTSKTQHPDEIRILQYFSREDLAGDSRNHCPPIIATLAPPDDPDIEIYVIPILRQYDDPPFDTIGEAIDFLRQILEGFVFLHEHRVAHRDIKGDNILLDPTSLGISDWHFSRPDRQATDIDRAVKVKYTRTQRRPKYYITDFGYSTLYAQDEANWPPMEPPKPASDNSLPELQSDDLCDPFPVDVYYVGNWMRLEFINGDPNNFLRPGFEGSFNFLTPVIDAMTKETPSDRITMQEALTQFDAIVSSLSSSPITSWKIMTSAPVSRTPYPIDARLARAVQHLLRRFKYLLLRLPPVPSAPPSPAPPAKKDLPDAAPANVNAGEAKDPLAPATKAGSDPKAPGESVTPAPPSNGTAGAVTPDDNKPSGTGGARGSSDAPVSTPSPAPAITVSIPSSSLTS
ncbi:other/AgaK1 protein kinase [Coprinopsis sp. MPI-PUGE-AT-0042]|nr:other/AgaK1 protein kinase [Coprinopsis sp. MPI-PUGE-AT-0042]